MAYSLWDCDMVEKMTRHFFFVHDWCKHFIVAYESGTCLIYCHEFYWSIDWKIFINYDRRPPTTKRESLISILIYRFYLDIRTCLWRVCCLILREKEWTVTRLRIRIETTKCCACANKPKYNKFSFKWFHITWWNILPLKSNEIGSFVCLFLYSFSFFFREQKTYAWQPHTLHRKLDEC